MKIPRPSTLYYMSLCPGYVSVENSDGKDAERGTLLHACVENGTPELAENEFDRDQVVKAMRYRKEILAALPRNPPPKSFKEMKLHGRLHPKGGSADEVIFSKRQGKREADVIDYKFGFIPVSPPKENAQMLSYVCMAFDTVPDLHEVRVHVIFPGLNLKATDAFHREDVPSATQVIHAVAESVETATPADYRPGTPCAYCARCSRCPRILADAEPTFAEVTAHVLRAPAEAGNVPSLFSLNPEDTSDDNLRKARTVAKATIEMLENAVKGIDAEVIARGAALFGYRTQTRSGSWTVRDVAGLLGFLAQDMPEIFSNTTPQGVSNLLRLLSDTEPTVPVTRLFPALHQLLENLPEGQRPLRYVGMNPTELRNTVLMSVSAYQAQMGAGAEIVTKGADSTFVVKAAKLGYDNIFAGVEGLKALDAAAEENT